MTEKMELDSDTKTENGTEEKGKDEKGKEEKGWMEQLGEYVIWGWIRANIERKYKHKLYIPIAIKGECLKYLGLEFIDSQILITEQNKNSLFSILSSQSMHSNILSGLKLLYRASENQFSAASFHQLCDGEKNVITIIQSKEGNIFGGYLKVGFSSSTPSKWIEDDKCFLFSINDNNDIFTIQEYEEEYASKSLSTCGPCFGGGFDLVICDKCDTIKESYVKMGDTFKITNATKMTGSTDNWESKIKFNFFVKDYEVFQFLS